MSGSWGNSATFLLMKKITLELNKIMSHFLNEFKVGPVLWDLSKFRQQQQPNHTPKPEFPPKIARFPSTFSFPFRHKRRQFYCQVNVHPSQPSPWQKICFKTTIVHLKLKEGTNFSIISVPAFAIQEMPIDG
jgi:hypothetical protein